MRINARAGALLLHDRYVSTPGAFWSVDLDIYIYIFKISMSHDLRVSSLASLACCNYMTMRRWMMLVDIKELVGNVLNLNIGQHAYQHLV